jgi:hypothetical protein
VVVARRASGHTPDKDWPDPYRDALAARLAARATVIDVGGPPPGPPLKPEGSYLDPRGQATRAELKCLHQITPNQVLSAMDQLGSNASPSNRATSVPSRSP